MQITSSSYASGRNAPLSFRFQTTSGRIFALLFILLLAGLSSLPAQAQSAQLKRLASALSSDLPDGSKVTLVSDGPLNDYKTYTAANRFYVVLPRVSASPATADLKGRGFSDAKAEQSGEDLLLSFALQPGATARVSQKFNRLDVIFNATNEAQPRPSRTEAVAIMASDALPSSRQETVKAAAVKVGSVELPPEKSQPVQLQKFDKPPVLDGKLDEEVWKQATVLKDFYQIQPGDNIAPSKPTEVLLGYDARNLYIAFRAFDEPDKVRATVAKRDNIFSDDYVGFFLDTFNDQRKAFEIFFNPFGVQGDGVITEGRGEDFSVDLLLDSKGLVNEQGYIVEIAIPFKSLRYEAGKGKLWGAHFFRRIKRFNNELDSWMPFSRSISNDLSQAGHLTGLEGISTERTIELIPSLTLSETARRVGSFSPAPGVIDGGRIVNEPLKFDPGLTGKFGISPNVTLDFTLNPDFAQVEADQLVVTTNQRFPIFFEEKRPFFLEGIDIFRTNLLPVHTRAIVDPDAAVKLTGKKGRDTFGIMLASDNGPGNLSADDRGRLNACREQQAFDIQFNRSPNICRNDNIIDKNAYIGVLRLKHDVGKSDSTIGMLATTYNFIEKHNQLGGFDGRFRINKQTVFDFQALGTTSRNFFYDPDKDRNIYRTGNGFAYATTYDVSGRNWGWQVYGEGYTQDYRADVGFVGRVNSNFNSFYVRYNTDPKPKAFFIGRHTHNFTHFDYNWQGQLYAWESENLVEFTLPRNSYFGVAYEYAYERLFEDEFGPRRRAATPGDPGQEGAFYGPDDERSSSKNHYFVYGGSQFNKKYQFNFRAVYRDGAFDFDFGGGDRYPRVSPAALLLGQNAPFDPGTGGLFEFTGGITYQPTNLLRMSLNLIKQRLVRHDTGLVAFDVNIFTYRATYQFTRATFARAIVDYNTLDSRARGQFLLGWTPSPGTAFYAGYNDDINYGGFSPINGQLEPGFRRNGRTLFLKLSYLFRRSFGAK
ncbi:MAG: hypothetical protein QOF02_4201 [Blastocatellia bacterium]|nr:hypothetical protein [Blastocatellia bacterium]